MKRIITFLRSEACVFVAISCVMIVQIAHNTFVVYTKSQIQTTWLAFSFATFYAFAIEFSILTYVINNMRTHAIAYAIASFITNLFYYYAPDSKIAPVMISAMLAGSIWSFSDLFYKKINPIQDAKITKELDLKITIKKYPCTWEGCKESFDESSKLNGHMSVHKRMQNKENNLNIISESNN